MFGLLKALFAPRKKKMRRPSANQIQFAKDLGIKVQKDWDWDKVSQEIEKAKADPAARKNSWKKRMKREKEEALPDVERFGEAAVAEEAKWEGLEGKTFLGVYRKKGIKTVEVFHLEETELKKGKDGGHLSLSVTLPKLERGEGFTMVAFEKPSTIRAQDLLWFEEVDDPYEKEHLEELRKIGEKQAKKLQ